MKKKAITITAIVLAMVATLALAGVAVGIGIRQKGEGTTTSDFYYKDGDIAAQMLYEAPDGRTSILTYKESRETASGKPLHYYEDDEGGRYSFDENGELIGYQAGEKQSGKTETAQPENNVSVTEPSQEQEAQTNQAATSQKAQATDLRNTEDAPTTPEEKVLVDRARQFAIGIYGEDYFSRFTYSKIHIDTALKNSDVYFYIRYKDRFITECCIATLFDDKSIGTDDASIFGKGIDDDFDPTLLEDIEIAELEQFALGQLKEDYPSYESYEIEEDITVVRNDNGGFDLSIAVQVHRKGSLSSDRVKYLYPLG